MCGWVGGWMDGRAGLRIAYSNQEKSGAVWVGGLVGGWVGGWMEAKAGSRTAYSNKKLQLCKNIFNFK